MTIDPATATVNLQGVLLTSDLALGEVERMMPASVFHLLISHGTWQTFRVVDAEAACHLVFQAERLSRLEIAFRLARDAAGTFSDSLERERHAAHEAYLLREIGATDWCCPDGSRMQ